MKNLILILVFMSFIIASFSQTPELFKSGEYYGYKNPTTGEVIKDSLHFAEPFQNGAASVGIRQYKRNTCWHIKQDGSLLYNQTYKAVYSFSKKGFAVCKSDTYAWVIINMKGKEVAAYEGRTYPDSWNEKYLDY
jgi:hypothetical protein